MGKLREHNAQFFAKILQINVFQARSERSGRRPLRERSSDISKNCHSNSQSEIPYYMRVEINLCGEFGTLISSFHATLYKGQIPYYMRVEINPVRRIWDTYFQFSCDTLQGSDSILHAHGNKSVRRIWDSYFQFL